MQLEGIVPLLLSRPGATVALRFGPDGQLEMGVLSIEPSVEDWFYLPITIESIAVDGQTIDLAGVVEVNPRGLEPRTNGLKVHSSPTPAHLGGPNGNRP